MLSLNVVLRYRRYDIAQTKHDSIRDNGLELFKDLHKELTKNFKVNYGIRGGILTADCLFVHDLPNIKGLSWIIFSRIVKPKRKILLMILETPIALPHWLLRINWLFTKVIVHADNPDKIIHQYECDTTIYPGIHDSFDSEAKINTRSGKRKYKIVMAARHLSSIKEFSTYKLKRRVAKKIGSMENCQLYGSGWNYYPLPMEAGLINGIYNKSELLKEMYSKCRGYKALESILGATTEQIYRSGVFSVCIDPDGSGESGTLERTIESITYGCIPIYYGSKNIKNILPSNIFIDARKFGSYFEAIEYALSLNNDEIEKYRSEIDIFLCSEESKKFRNRNWAKYIAEWAFKNA